MSETIAIGGRSFEVRPLKLGQLRHLFDALEEMTGKSGGGLIEAAAKVVAAGLQPAHPGLGAEALLDLEAGIDELNGAVAAILRLAGLHPREAAPGEGAPVAGPGTSPGSSSAPSTAPSPPAAAIPTRSSME
jgi:hypothetical protein